MRSSLEMLSVEIPGKDDKVLAGEKTMATRGSNKKPNAKSDDGGNDDAGHEASLGDDAAKDERSGEGDAENESPRRSNRKRTSTVIHVKGGYAVKKANNYVVKGMTYVHGAINEDEIVKPAAKKKPRTTATAKAVNARPPKQQSAQELRRMDCKNDMAQAIQTKKPLRDAFLKQHLSALAPFIEPKIKAKIIDTNSSDKAPSKELQVSMQPDGIQTELRDYQLQGLEFMARMHACNMGMILGDEMGLGKTIQTISMICYLKEQYSSKGPSLIVCPLSVLYSWCNEIKKWAPSLKYLRLHCSTTTDVSIHEEDLTKYDMVITTYEMVKAQSLLRIWQRQAFHLLVLDEGHLIKAGTTDVALVVRKIHAENRLILTGTPLANNLVELYNLLSFLAPDVFTTSEPFAEAFDLTVNKVDPAVLNQAHTLLSVFMLRRLKEKVEKLLPTNLETKVICPLSTTQIWWYKALLLKDISILANGGTKQGAQLSNLIMQLRKCCLHPFLFDGAEDIDSTTLETLVGASGKLTVLDKLLCSLYQKKHRVCLFSQFTQVLDILEDYCVMRGWNFCRFDGSTARAKRNYVVNSFNAPDSDRFLFLMSTRAGGMGLNLQTADTCILYDSDWNPQSDLQAMARVCRIGQTKKVHTYRLVTKGTVEERMIERAEKKLYLDRMVTRDGSECANDGDELRDVGVLMATLRFGCGAVFGNGSTKCNTIPSDEDIALITDRNRTDDFSCGNLKGGIATTVDKFDATTTFSSTTNFAGIDFAQIRKHYNEQKRPESITEIGAIWRKKREGKNRIQMVDAKGSGYGSAVVPVLKSNNYSLETGERSVYDQELLGRHVASRKKPKAVFEHQDFCQVCNDGGRLLMCPRCPCCVHLECAGVHAAKEFLCCSHHRCAICGKASSAAGGFIFPCSSCHQAYCEDHLPQEASFLEPCQRMEAFGFTLKLGVYVHCTKECEHLAVKEFGYVPIDKSKLQSCPPVLDLSFHFGGEIDDSLDPPEELVLHHKRQRKPVQYNSNGASNVGTQGTIVESPDKNDDTDGDFNLDARPVQAAGRNQVSKWQDAVAPAASVQVLVDGLPPPLSAQLKQPVRRNGKPSAELIFGEYDVLIPVDENGIGLLIVQQHGFVVFASYRTTPDGSSNFAERNRVIRNIGDVIVRVDGVSTKGKALDKVVRMVQKAANGKSAVALRFFDKSMTRYGAQPFAGVMGQHPLQQANSHMITDKPASNMTGVPALKTPAAEYTAVIPSKNGQLMIKVEAGPAGIGSFFAGYARNDDGSLGPAESLNLIGSVGDRIIGIDGSSMIHMQHTTILFVLREHAKTQSSVRVRFQETVRSLDQDDSTGSSTDSILARGSTVNVSSAASSLAQNEPHH